MYTCSCPKICGTNVHGQETDSFVQVNFSRGRPVVLLGFNNIIVFESEHNKQYLFTISSK